MFLLYVIPVGVVLGFILGGRLSGIGKLPLRWLWLLPPSLLIQLLIFPSFTSRALFPYATSALHLVSYGLLAVWIVANLHILPMAVLGLGAISNATVLIANGGFMPASLEAIQKAGMFGVAEILRSEGVYSNLILMSESTRLDALGDVLFVPKWIPLASAFSIGDLLILAALVWLIVKGMAIDGKRASTTT